MLLSPLLKRNISFNLKFSQIEPAKIVDSDVAVVEASNNQVRVGGADVKREYSAVGQASVFRIGRVLQAAKIKHFLIVFSGHLNMQIRPILGCW